MTNILLIIKRLIKILKGGFVLDKIRNQFILAFLVVSVIPLLIMGISNHISSRSKIQEGLLIKYNNDLNLEMNRINTFLIGVRKDILVMSDSPTLHNMLSSSEDEYHKQRKILEKEYLAMSQNKKIFSQVRYLNKKGIEVVRVDSDGTKFIIVSEDKLQDKTGRYYFKDSIKLNKGEIFVSALDLNREREQIERPYKPVIRYATPVFHNGEQSGIIIVNVLANNCLNPIKKMNSEDEYYLLFSNEGYYFSNPEPAKEWGGPSDLNTKENVNNEFPDKVSSVIMGSGIESIDYGENIITQSIFYPNSNVKDVYWKLIKISKKEIVFATLYSLLKIFIFTLVIALVFAFIIALMMSKTITEPVIQLTRAAEAISRGKLDVPIKIYGSSEIMSLGKTIQRLKESLEIAIKHLTEQVGEEEIEKIKEDKDS